MRLKETAQKRIFAKENAQKVLRSTISFKDGIKKIDKDSMRNLISLSDYEKVLKRDLELYIGYGNTLVLDNELPVYKTDIDDVVIRKSPVLKEMVKIRNIIKILWDGSVIVTKGKDTVEMLKKTVLDALPLKINKEDINNLKYEGLASIESKDFSEIIKTVDIFAEITGFETLKSPYSLKNVVIYGKVKENIKGPFIILNKELEVIRFCDLTIERDDKESISELLKAAGGISGKFPQGREVFEELEKIALSLN